MDAKPKKNIRSTHVQIRHLCQYMAANPEFAAGDYKTPLGASKLHEEWVKLKSSLDLLGPRRTVQQWKICWRDQKRKARVEGGAHNHAVNTTCNQHPVPAVGDKTELLNATGTDMAVGMGLNQSPIGFQLSPKPPPQSVPPRAKVPYQQRPVRARRQTPPTALINAQLELNTILKELVTEVKAARVAQEALVVAQEALVNEVQAIRVELSGLSRVSYLIIIVILSPLWSMREYFDMCAIRKAQYIGHIKYFPKFYSNIALCSLCHREVYPFSKKFEILITLFSKRLVVAYDLFDLRLYLCSVSLSPINRVSELTKVAAYGGLPLAQRVILPDLPLVAPICM